MPDEVPPPESSASVTPPRGTRAPDAGLVRVAGGFYALVALFALGYAFFDLVRRARPLPEDYAFLGLRLPTLGLALAGIGIGLALVAVVHLGLKAVAGVEEGARVMARMLGPVRIRAALLLAVFSGVGEELLFRGALWSHLGLVGTSFLFALVHFVPRRALWAYPLFALVAGLLLGLLRDASGSVIPPILAHVTVNAINLAWLGRQHARLVGSAPAPQPDA